MATTEPVNRAWMSGELLVREHCGVRIITRLRIDPHFWRALNAAVRSAFQNETKPALERDQAVRHVLDTQDEMLSQFERKLIYNYATRRCES